MNLTATSSWLQRFALPPLRVSTILIGFSVPISVALDNLLLAIVLLGVLFNTPAIWRMLRTNSVARATGLLFAVLSFATIYGTTPWREALGTLGKYIDLAFVPMFMLLLCGARYRQWAQYAFLGAMGLTLLLSYLVGLELLPAQKWMSLSWASPGNPVIFHSHITQNNMMAFAVFLALLNARDTPSTKLRMLWGVAALLGAINVLFMVQGRTGYLILLTLLGWFAWSTLARHMRKLGRAWRWPQGVAALLTLAGFVTMVYHLSPRLHDRLTQVVSEYQEWEPNHGVTSTGQRLDFYYNTAQLVRQHPVFGVGTGGFPAAFAQQVKGTDALPTNNPHNEFLMISVQTGMAGLALLLFLFYTIWRNAPLLDTPLGQDAARGLVLAYLVNCSFNSALLDHGDGLFFSFMAAALFAGLKVNQKYG